MQPRHISDDVRISDKYLGLRTTTTYAINSLITNGCHVVFGSDMPVADPDPLKGIIAAIGRRYQLDINEPSWHPEQSVSAEQALKAYTRNAAYASYEEDLKGTLTPGKLADFITVSQALESGTESSLTEAKVNITVLGGEIVFGDA
jgi:predicted amidohydrolase YtcJ